MSNLLKYIALFVLLATICARVEIGKDWKQFNSNTGFSVMYPPAWFRIAISSEDRLDILSSKGGAEAVVIKHGQAEIIVMETQGPATASLTQIIDWYSQGDPVLLHKDIHNESAGRQGCSNLKEAVFKDEVVPGWYIIDTGFFCEINGRKFVTMLRNWQEDKRQQEYQQTALNVAKTLRLKSQE